MCSRMEQPFYHDDSMLSPYTRADPSLLKPSLASLADQYRAQKHDLSAYYPEQPSLKMSAPELERLIIHSGPGVINSAAGGGGGGQQLFYRGGTEEQEGFVDGFVRALDDLHKMNRDTAPPNVSLTGAATVSPVTNPGLYGGADPAVYTNLSAYTNCYRQPSATISYLPPAPGYGSAFKEEPQTVPDTGDSRDSTPAPMSPINMEEQEKIKVERKRLRNRLAATKCRRRKLERIARLEDKVRELKSENSGLSGTAGALREQVEQLKGRVREHARHGCQLLLGGKGHSVF